MARPKRYKFTKKKRSRLAGISLIMSAAALAGFFVVLGYSVKTKGQSGSVIGIVGIVLSAVAVAALISAIVAVRNEDTFPVLPKVALVASIAALCVWVGVYILGFYFWNRV